jgi:glutaredoxin 3
MNIVILSKDDCAFCVKVKKLLSDFGYSFTEFEKGESTDVDQFFSDAGFTTYPQVFSGGKLLGGYEATLEWVTGKPIG